MKPLRGAGLALKLGGRWVLEEVDIPLQAGAMLGILGPNGAGKSSLLRILAGIQPPDRGTVLEQDSPLDLLAPAQRARLIAYLPQRPRVHWPISVERVVALGRLPHLAPWQSLAAADQAVIERVMMHTDVLHLRARPADQLSGGELARVSIARALATEAPWLLADEPVTALDPAHQLDVMDILRRHCAQGGGVALVLHDLALAAHYCQRLHLLVNGRTLAAGEADEVLTQTHLREAFGIRLNAESDDPRAALRLPWRRIHADAP